jgi:hypothetical protein
MDTELLAKEAKKKQGPYVSTLLQKQVTFHVEPQSEW